MSSLNVERTYSEPGLYLGRSTFTAAGWQGHSIHRNAAPRISFALMALSSAGRGNAKIARYINGRCLLPEKFKGYRLRVTEGELKGLWLTRIDVTTKDGIAFRGSPNWQEVSLRPDQFQINPRFQEDESAAWLGLSQQNALTFQTIVLSTGIQMEIVDP
jgi:hypothetical protein